MVWMGIAVMLATGIIAILVASTSRADPGLGTVSAHWIARHKVDAP